MAPELQEPVTVPEALRALLEDVREIKEEVKKTNGRVRSLELWRAFVAGGIALLGAAGIPSIIYLIIEAH